MFSLKKTYCRVMYHFWGGCLWGIWRRKASVLFRIMCSSRAFDIFRSSLSDRQHLHFYTATDSASSKTTSAVRNGTLPIQATCSVSCHVPAGTPCSEWSLFVQICRILSSSFFDKKIIIFGFLLRKILVTKSRMHTETFWIITNTTCMHTWINKSFWNAKDFMA